MEIRDRSTMAVDDKCWFLTIPLEIRLNIYGYLVTPDNKIRLDRRRGLPNSGVYVQFNLSILAANRQIFDEASPLFYSSVTLQVRISDLEFLEPHLDGRSTYPPLEGCWTSLIRRNVNITNKNPLWRFDPMMYVRLDCGPKQPGEEPYDEETWVTWEGSMEPHVFMRFQNISVAMGGSELDSYFEKEFYPPWSTSQNASSLRSSFQQSHLMHVLTTLLSGVLALKSLEIILEVDADFEEWATDGMTDEDLEECISDEKLPSDGIIQSSSNGFRYSLGKLSNVQAFEIKVLAFDTNISEPEYRELGQVSGKVIERLKGELSTRASNLPVDLTRTKMARRLVKERGRSLECFHTQLQAIGDRNLTPGMRETLLEMIELQKAHQERMDKMQSKIDEEFEEFIKNDTYEHHFPGFEVLDGLEMVEGKI